MQAVNSVVLQTAHIQAREASEKQSYNSHVGGFSAALLKPDTVSISSDAVAKLDLDNRLKSAGIKTVTFTNIDRQQAATVDKVKDVISKTLANKEKSVLIEAGNVVEVFSMAKANAKVPKLITQVDPQFVKTKDVGFKLKFDLKPPTDATFRDLKGNYHFTDLLKKTAEDDATLSKEDRKVINRLADMISDFQRNRISSISLPIRSYLNVAQQSQLI